MFSLDSGLKVRGKYGVTRVLLGIYIYHVITGISWRYRILFHGYFNDLHALPSKKIRPVRTYMINWSFQSLSSASNIQALKA